jgi:2Fe-2S ferredoxin
MSSIKVTLVQADGVARTLENVASGRTLMEVARDHGVEGILGDCGGGCMCATCHVYVDAAWRERVGPPNEVELDVLDMASNVRPEASRLSCQIALREELDGLKVEVAPM